MRRVLKEELLRELREERKSTYRDTLNGMILLLAEIKEKGIERVLADADERKMGTILRKIFTRARRLDGLSRDHVEE